MWLYVPNISTSSPSAQVDSALISASSWQFQALEQSAWSRGKPSRSRSWYQQWKRAIWLQRLFGAMPEPSMAEHGVAQLTASLAASRASRTVSPAVSKARMTNATSGLTLAASSSNPERSLSLSKMSQACSRQGLTKSLAPSGFAETFTSLASRWREDCSRRQKLARRTRESVFLSSAWPTPDASVAQDGETPETWLARRERVKLTAKNGNGMGTPLAMAAVMFQASARPTPTANDWKGSGPTLERSDGQMRGDRLDYATEQLWYTPNVPNGGRTLSADTSPTGKTADGMKRQVGLENQANWWMTPRSHEVGQYQYSRGDKEKPVPRLTGQALDMEAYQTSNTWPTPTAMNRPRSDETLEKCRAHRKEKAGQNTVPLYLEDLASRISLQGQETQTDGEKSSPERRSLNPLFVEWLMGWPPNWTLVAWTDFGCSAMELSHWKQRMRSALLSLGLPQEAPPAQLALFG